jgi:hypothetical protein
MNEALEILRRERTGALEQIRVMRVRIRDLESAINVLEGQPAQSLPTGRVTGEFKSSILTKLQNLGAVGSSPKELAEAFISEGRITSDASVSSTLSRLKGESVVINRHGRWFAVNLAVDSAVEADLNADDVHDVDEDPEAWIESDDDSF